MRYDPKQKPDPEVWNSLDEQERITLVHKYHRLRRIRMPNAEVHATIHVIVENQIAMGDEFPALGVSERLMAEGLTRHEAVHAIGSVLAEHMFNLLKKGGSEGVSNEAYINKLKKLTAESWRLQFGADAPDV